MWLVAAVLESEVLQCVAHSKCSSDAGNMIILHFTLSFLFLSYLEDRFRLGGHLQSTEHPLGHNSREPTCQMGTLED